MKEEVQSVVFMSSVKVPGKGEVTSCRWEEAVNGRLSISVEGGILTLDDGKALARVPLTNVRSWVPKVAAPAASKEPKR